MNPNDGVEDYEQWAVVPETDGPVPWFGIAVFAGISTVVALAFIGAANVLVWALSMIGGG